MPTMAQSTVMGQLCSISFEGLKHVAPKWNYGSSKVGLLVLPLGQWCGIVAYQTPSLYCYDKNLLGHGRTASTGHEMPSRQVH